VSRKISRDPLVREESVSLENNFPKNQLICGSKRILSKG
jgi:hypothetical protein